MVEATPHVNAWVQTLWDILADDANAEIVSWNADGDGFVIHQPGVFESVTLPTHYSTTSLASFIRSLNHYSFVKVNYGSKQPAYRHPSFLRDRPDLLPSIKPNRGRRAATLTPSSALANRPRRRVRRNGRYGGSSDDSDSGSDGHAAEGGTGGSRRTERLRPAASQLGAVDAMDTAEAGAGLEVSDADGLQLLLHMAGAGARTAAAGSRGDGTSDGAVEWARGQPHRHLHTEGAGGAIASLPAATVAGRKRHRTGDHQPAPHAAAGSGGGDGGDGGWEPGATGEVTAHLRPSATSTLAPHDRPAAKRRRQAGAAEDETGATARLDHGGGGDDEADAVGWPTHVSPTLQQGWGGGYASAGAAPAMPGWRPYQSAHDSVAAARYWQATSPAFSGGGVGGYDRADALHQLAAMTAFGSGPAQRALPARHSALAKQPGAEAQLAADAAAAIGATVRPAALPGLTSYSGFASHDASESSDIGGGHTAAVTAAGTPPATAGSGGGAAPLSARLFADLRLPGVAAGSNASSTVAPMDDGVHKGGAYEGLSPFVHAPSSSSSSGSMGRPLASLPLPSLAVQVPRLRGPPPMLTESPYPMAMTGGGLGADTAAGLATDHHATSSDSPSIVAGPATAVHDPAQPANERHLGRLKAGGGSSSGSDASTAMELPTPIQMPQPSTQAAAGAARHQPPSLEVDAGGKGSMSQLPRAIESQRGAAQRGGGAPAVEVGDSDGESDETAAGAAQPQLPPVSVAQAFAAVASRVLSLEGYTHTMHQQLTVQAQQAAVLMARIAALEQCLDRTVATVYDAAQASDLAVEMRSAAGGAPILHFVPRGAGHSGAHVAPSAGGGNIATTPSAASGGGIGSGLPYPTFRMALLAPLLRQPASSLPHMLAEPERLSAIRHRVQERMTTQGRAHAPPPAPAASGWPPLAAPVAPPTPESAHPAAVHSWPALQRDAEPDSLPAAPPPLAAADPSHAQTAPFALSLRVPPMLPMASFPLPPSPGHSAAAPSMGGGDGGAAAPAPTDRTIPALLPPPLLPMHTFNEEGGAAGV